MAYTDRYTDSNVSAEDLSLAANGSEFGIRDHETRAFWRKVDGVWYVIVPQMAYLGPMPENRPMEEVLDTLQFYDRIFGAVVQFNLKEA